MTAGSSDQTWEDDIVHGLKSLTTDEIPSLEIILLDAVVDWLFSAENPGEGYTEEHAGRLVSTLFSAMDAARTLRLTQQPAVTEQITHARERVAEGAHELAAEGADGVSLLVSRAMPAVLTELDSHAGERAKQAHGVFVYLFYALSTGTRTEHDTTVIEGLAAAFLGWDQVLRDGFTLPWRRTSADPT